MRQNHSRGKKRMFGARNGANAANSVGENGTQCTWSESASVGSAYGCGGAQHYCSAENDRKKSCGDAVDGIGSTVAGSTGRQGRAASGTAGGDGSSVARGEKRGSRKSFASGVVAVVQECGGESREQREGDLLGVRLGINSPHGFFNIFFFFFFFVFFFSLF